MNVFEIVSPLGMCTVGVAFAGVWSVLCRISVMGSGTTRLRVVLQHFGLATGLFAAAVWSVNWDLAREFGASGWVVDLLGHREIGPLVMVTSVLVFLLLSAHRWRLNAPEGTKRRKDGPEDDAHPARP